MNKCKKIQPGKGWENTLKILSLTGLKHTVQQSQ